MRFRLAWCAGILAGMPAFAGTGAARAASYIVYSRATGTDRTIWISSGDGQFDAPITQGSWPRLSRDGRYLLFLRGFDPANVARGSLFLRDLQTGVERLVFNNNDYVVGYDFSPDGTKILFDYSCGIYTMDRDGANVQTLFSADCYDDAPQWNPAGTQFAYHNIHAGLVIASPDGASRKLIPNTVAGDAWPAWSRDGAWIAFVNGKDLYKIKPDGTGRTRLSTLPGKDDAFGPVRQWNPDDLALTAPGTVNGAAGLFTVKADGSGSITPLQTAAGNMPDFVGAVVSMPDSDGDHVPDIFDASPGTPPGTTVNAAGVPLDACFAPPAGLVAWWRGDGDASDAKGTANGTLQGGATFGSGKVGQAFSLSGTGAYIPVPDSPTLHPTSLTLEGWFNFTTAPSTIRTLFGKAAGTGFYDSYIIWWESGSLRAVAGGPGNEGPSLIYPWTPPGGEWHHAAFTVDAASKVQTLYVDGIARAALTSDVPIVCDTHALLIGADYQYEGIAFFFPGRLDEVSLYNRALTATEVSGIYYAGAAGKCTTTLPLLHLLRVTAGLDGATSADIAAFDTNGDGRIALADVAKLAR